MWSLALKNLFRDKRRTFLTFIVLSVAILYYIVFSGMLGGFESESIRNFLSLQSAHLKLYSRDYNEETFEGYIWHPSQLIDNINKLKFVKALTERLKILGFLDNGVDQFPVLITGIKEGTDTIIFKLRNYVNESLEGGIWIGSNIAKNFKVNVGDYLFLNFRGGNGVIVSKEMRIAGIIQCPDIVINNSYIYLDLDSLREMGNFKKIATEIDIVTEDYRKVERYKKELSQKLNNYRITTWMEEGSDFLSITKAKSAAQGVLIFFIVLIGIIGTANTLLISVFEKTREIGTLKAIGMIDGEIMGLFLREGLLIGISGSLLGILSGVLINWYLVVHGIDWTPLLGDMDVGYKVMGVVKNTWSIKTIIISFLIGPLSTLFASYFPAKKAMKMTPSECLRWI